MKARIQFATYAIVVAIYLTQALFGTPEPLYRVFAILNMCYCYWMVESAISEDDRDGPATP
jgi:hypothetical protein